MTRQRAIPRQASARFATSIQPQAYTAEELEFMQAVDAYKTSKRRPFPTYREILSILRELGYSKAAIGEHTPPEDEKSIFDNRPAGEPIFGSSAARRHASAMQRRRNYERHDKRETGVDS